MKITYAQFQLQRTKPLNPPYLISGEEYLFQKESLDFLRQKAKDEGFSHRYSYTVESGFSWQELLDTSNTFSLFKEKKCVELHIPTGKPGDKGSKALKEYCEHNPKDTCLIVITGKLDSAQQKSAWVKALETTGTHLQLYPLQKRELLPWLKQRMVQHKLSIDEEGLRFLAENVEGNLLAAAQAFEKLSLLYESKPLSTQEIANTISNSARFDIFTLVDTALLGNAFNTLRVLRELKTEGIEPILILWALSREIRSLAKLAYELEQGNSFITLAEKHRIWSTRKLLVHNALKSISCSQWENLLQKAFRIDGLIKGQHNGNVWSELESLALGMGSQ